MPGPKRRTIEDRFADYLVVSQLSRSDGRKEGERRLPGVDLAVRGLKGERPGLQPEQR